jgi:hypothetical protein
MIKLDMLKEYMEQFMTHYIYQIDASRTYSSSKFTPFLWGLDDGATTIVYAAY